MILAVFITEIHSKQLVSQTIDNAEAVSISSNSNLQNYEYRILYPRRFHGLSLKYLQI